MSESQKQTLRYLALGDSYTIGTSVKPEESFPQQLSDKLRIYLGQSIDTTIIATRGWTTEDLIKSLPKSNRAYSLVTLLIGVNDLYDGIAFDAFCKRLRTLLSATLSLSRSAREKIVILSIPDYTYTPFAREKEMNVSLDINRYNKLIRNYCEESQLHFLNITDISRRGFDEPNLVAEDGLHLSSKAYKEISDRLFDFISNTPRQNP